MSTVTENPLSMVTASLLVGTLAPDAPPEVVDHVLVELQLPVATAYRCAIAVAPSATISSAVSKHSLKSDMCLF
jgi:hypothetical protein